MFAANSGSAIVEVVTEVEVVDASVSTAASDVSAKEVVVAAGSPLLQPATAIAREAISNHAGTSKAGLCKPVVGQTELIRELCTSSPIGGDSPTEADEALLPRERYSFSLDDRRPG
jgi:hypothetical protein